MKLKQLLIVCAVMLFSVSISAQSLLDIYKKGTVKLVADPEFGKNNDWDKVLVNYYDSLYGRPVGKRMNLVVKPDGSLVINHAYQNFYSQFNANGSYNGKLTVKGSSGKDMKVNGIEGILNNSIFFTGLNNMGKMNCFDFNGKYIKSLTLNYATKQMISLGDHKLAVVGWAIWKDRFRDFIAIVDYNTNQEKVIWEYYTTRSNEGGAGDNNFMYSRNLKKGGMISVITMPFKNNLGLRPSPVLAFLNNKLIVAFPTSGEIYEYTTDGQLVKKDKVNWSNSEVSVDEQVKIQKNFIDGYSKMLENFKKDPLKNADMIETYTDLINSMTNDLGKITQPIPMPYFSKVIKDSDNNLLFFEYVKQGNANKFNVYTYNGDGKFVCQSSFQCDDYNLEINEGKLVYYKGFIYGLQELKNATGNPVRLVKFKLTN